MPAHTASPAQQALTIAWIQSARTLRTYLATLPLPINIGDPTNPDQLENIDTDLNRAHRALTDAPIPAELADHLRQATTLLLLALRQIGQITHAQDIDLWEFEAAHLTLRQANAALNRAGKRTT